MRQINKNSQLPDETLVKVIAYAIGMDEEFTKVMTFKEWLNLKKDKKYNYKCLQI